MDKIEEKRCDCMVVGRRIRQHRRKLMMPLEFSASEEETVVREHPTTQHDFETWRRDLRAQLEEVGELGRVTKILIEHDTPGGANATEQQEK